MFQTAVIIKKERLLLAPFSNTIVIVDLAYFNEYSQRFYCALFSIPSDSKKELLLQTSFIKQYVLSDTGLDHVDI